MTPIERFNPARAKELTVEDLAAMQGLTVEDLKELAKAYPNSPSQAAYLILLDTKKKPKEQLYSLSTWANLYNLHKLGQTHFAALSFKSVFNKSEQNLKVAPVQDLTTEEKTNAPGLTKARRQPVKAVTSKPVLAPAQKLEEGVDDFPDLAEEAKANDNGKAAKKSPAPKKAVVKPTTKGGAKKK